MVRFCTLRISKIMQTLENIEIADNFILASVTRLSKKMIEILANYGIEKGWLS